MYRTKSAAFIGHHYYPVNKQATHAYNSLRRITRRRPYIRSAYFLNKKVFVDTFWQHMWQKNWHDRRRRLRYLGCAIELIRDSTVDPYTIQNPNNKDELLHRFVGMTPKNELFYVQIKENIRTGQKSLMSVFPVKKQKNLG